MWRFILFLQFFVFLLPAQSLAHWDYGNGHMASAVAEWVIIIASLAATFVLAFRNTKKAEGSEACPMDDIKKENG